MGMLAEAIALRVAAGRQHPHGHVIGGRLLVLDGAHFAESSARPLLVVYGRLTQRKKQWHKAPAGGDRILPGNTLANLELEP